MLIRKKLLLATTIPIGLLVVQVLLVNVFIRELQLAVQFIGSAQQVIEADLKAKDVLVELRKQIKNIPQIYVQPNNSPSLIAPLWQEIGHNMNLINNSSVISTVNVDVVASVQSAYAKAEKELEKLTLAVESGSATFNALLLHAITTNDALNNLDRWLVELAVELRFQLQQAVDREQEIHNRPVIAGAVVGGLAVTLLIILIWLFVEKGIIRRLTQLSQSMLGIAGGDLHTEVLAHQSADEIGKMSQALSIFRDNAIEIRENNLREVAQQRKQRQFWLEHMASFLRHEVKNKQVGAEQSIRLLSSKESSNSQVTKYCNRATTSLVEMRELINNTVDAADIESSLLSEDFTVLDVQNLLHIYTQKMTEQIGERLVLRDETIERCYIKGDEHRLKQMLDKLVSNALDFKYAGTEVTICLAKNADEQVSIGVNNKGPNLQKDKQVLFGLSYSLRSPEKKRPENVGFGLFVARRIADYHNGVIEADNTDCGVSFTVYLPLLINENPSTDDIQRQL